MFSRRRFLARGSGAVLGTLFLAGRRGAWLQAAGGEDNLPDGSAARGMITPAAQRAIDQGLAYLARNVREDGSFGTGQHEGSVAITSLAALSLMAGGHQPNRGAYGHVVTQALEYVISQEDAGRPGYLHKAGDSSHGPMYGHGFGTLFLAEASGVIHHKTLRDSVHETLKRAVDLIVRTQNARGGWRYHPGSTDADISVTICQIMALRSARNAGLYVPKETVDRCVRYVKSCQDRATGGFRYMDMMANGAAFARTAAGVAALYAAGVYKGPEVERGLEYLMRWLRDSQSSPRYDMHYFYGHYYAAQAMWTAGGSYWAEWYPAIREELINRPRLHADGSWPDQICNHYGTAMACIILQVPNNYLPILQK